MSKTKTAPAKQKHTRVDMQSSRAAKNTPARSAKRTTRSSSLARNTTKATSKVARTPKAFTHKSQPKPQQKSLLPLPKATFRLIFNQLILVFTIGCIFGTYYEEILTLCKNFFATGNIEWFSRRGLIYGPFSPVYGLGAVGIYLAFYRTRANKLVCFLGGALAGGVFEYGLSVLQELIFNTRSWNYSDRLLNIGGRTTIPYMLFWGLLVLTAVHWLYPLLEGAYARLQGKWLNIFCIGLAIFLAFDAALSIAANLRQTERREGDPANTMVEVFLDEHFPDERLHLVYENTVYVPEK